MAQLDTFTSRYWQEGPARPQDVRDDYQRDKGRIIHSFAFRRLQAKTQVMGVGEGEGDFHRTRLTHSIEAAQIGEGLLLSLCSNTDGEARNWLPPRDLLTAACLAHDLGHPPFGHAGERQLHRNMVDYGGFEGNAQTLRIVTKLERYRVGGGINPTRRLVLSLLKYPVRYSCFCRSINNPPKCYYDCESDVVTWAMRVFPKEDIDLFSSNPHKRTPEHRTLDSLIMEYADDIAYAVHDIEDVVARKLVSPSVVVDELRSRIFSIHGKVGTSDESAIGLDDFENGLLRGDDTMRKELFGKLVNFFITAARIGGSDEGFSHPLLRLRVQVDPLVRLLLNTLKDLTVKLVVKRPQVQQLERRGVKIVADLFDALNESPETLIPNWHSCVFGEVGKRRLVSDYVGGMTDRYAERIYRRLFIPGVGSSHDEL